MPLIAFPRRAHPARALPALGMALVLVWSCVVPTRAAEVAAERAAALPPGLTAVTTVEGITEYRLPNGLQLLLAPDASKPTTTVNLTYRVGSRHESYGETGMAHLLEHLVFKGTPTTPNALAEFGRRGMRANGTTWVDRTNYYASFAANDEALRWIIGWQADAMVNSFIAKEDLASEMTVVRNEMEAGENNPGRVLLERTLSVMYQWHNYGKSTIGARSDVENVDIARLQAFYRQWYQPDNATLIVAGRFDPARVLAWVAESFGPLPRPARALPATTTLDPPQDGERQLTVRRVGGSPLLLAAYHVPPASHPDHAAIALLGRVLGDAPGGRLHKALVEKKLAAGSFAFDLAFAEPGPFFAGAQLAPGQRPAAARAALLAELDALARRPVTAEELERARRQWLNGWDQAHTDPEAVGVMLSEAIALGDWRLFFLRRDEVQRLTLADINRVATTWLKPDNRTVAAYEPTPSPQRAPAPARVDVAALLQGYQGRAAAATVDGFDASPAALDAGTQRGRLAGGLQLALLPKPTRGQAVQGQLALHWGSVAALRGQGVNAEFMGALLDKGVAQGQTGSRGRRDEPALSRQQLADRFDALRAQVGFSASGQTLYVQWQTTREHAPALLSLLGRVLRQPALPAPALDELRAQWLAGLAQQRDDPGAVVSNALQRHGNPYPAGDLRHAQTFAEQEAAVRAATLAGVRQLHRRFVSAARGELALVGDFDPAAVRAAAQAAFGTWGRPAAGAAGAYERAPQPFVDLPPARLVLNTPDKANAHAEWLLPVGLNDSHADAMALALANRIFGGSPDSRLWLRVREREGLSYGIDTGVAFNEFEPHSRWRGSAIFAPGNQARVEAAVKEELARSLQDGFSADEVARARTAWLNERRLSRAQDDELARQLAGQLYLDRRFALSQQRDERIAALGADEVNAAWRRWIAPERIVWAWGGDFGKAAP